jgi:L-alanine-DL-glutamate epimerase-like enolase superfamily enzyme
MGHKSEGRRVPLWALLGGTPNKKIEVYDTDGGWLNWTIEELVSDSVRHVEEEGYKGVKIKVGSHDLSRDLERIEAVRKAIGPRVKLMVDTNGSLDLPSAIRFGQRLADYDVHWFEEPLWYDNVSGHATLARSISTPIALGEQLYTLDHFTSFVDAGGVHFVQVDAVRVAGGTEWWQVADLAPVSSFTRGASHRRHDAGASPLVHGSLNLSLVGVHPLVARVLCRARHHKRGLLRSSRSAGGKHDPPGWGFGEVRRLRRRSAGKKGAQVLSTTEFLRGRPQRQDIGSGHSGADAAA